MFSSVSSHLYYRIRDLKGRFTPEQVVAQFCKENGLFYKLHSDCPNLCLLSYHADANWNNPCVRECRGVILDLADYFAYVSRPYDKFFNYGDGNCDEIDLTKEFVSYEKEDGTCCVLYYYPGPGYNRNGWRVQTLGMPDACGSIGNSDKTFQDLFWETFDSLDYNLPPITYGDYTSYCYIFELLTPLNEIVVKHHESRLVLHGVRNVSIGRELQPETMLLATNWEIIASNKIEPTWGAILNFVNSRSAEFHEGVVVTQYNGGWVSRAKVKSLDYFVRHQGTNFTPRKALECVVSGQQYYLNDASAIELLDTMQQLFLLVETNIHAYFDKVKLWHRAKIGTEVPKPLKGIMFWCLDNKGDFLEYMRCRKNARNKENLFKQLLKEFGLNDPFPQNTVNSDSDT